MSTTQLRVIGFLVAAVVIFGSGVSLTRAGRPYGVALQTVHKLVALAAVVVVGVMAYQASRAGALSTLESTVVRLAGLFAVATFASGGVVSASETAPVWVLWLHRVDTRPFSHAGMHAGAGPVSAPLDTPVLRYYT